MSPIVRQKIPQFDAQQFVGGIANAKQAVPWATSSVTSAVWQPAYSEWGMQDGVVVEFKTPERLRLTDKAGGGESYANVGDWLVKNENGSIDVLSTAELTQQFEEVTPA